MSRIGKSNELNDIIDSAFTEPDYTFGNNRYDDNDHNHYNNNRTDNRTDNNNNNNYNNNYNNNNTNNNNKPFKQEPIQEKNMFLKYSQSSTNNYLQQNFNEKTKITITIDEDNFPSLTSKTTTKTTRPSTPAMPAIKPLDFKKVIQSKKEITCNPVIEPKYINHDMSYKYNEIRNNSEKNVKKQMTTEVSSDDDS